MYSLSNHFQILFLLTDFIESGTQNHLHYSGFSVREILFPIHLQLQRHISSQNQTTMLGSFDLPQNIHKQGHCLGSVGLLLSNPKIQTQTKSINQYGLLPNDSQQRHSKHGFTQLIHIPHGIICDPSVDEKLGKCIMAHMAIYSSQDSSYKACFGGICKRVHITACLVSPLNKGFHALVTWKNIDQKQ